MSFFDSLNGGLETFFKELAKSKRLEEKRRDNQFKELENTSLLFSSDYLSGLAEDADEEEAETILDYLYRFNNLETGEDEYLNILELGSYKSIENKIINKRW
ncbi:MAG: hypothetical protein Q8934_21375 [Bacillota bacterium]|nr:hypothetical protein [Bacillota bacterium]